MKDPKGPTETYCAQTAIAFTHIKYSSLCTVVHKSRPALAPGTLRWLKIYLLLTAVHQTLDSEVHTASIKCSNLFSKLSQNIHPIPGRGREVATNLAIWQQRGEARASHSFQQPPNLPRVILFCPLSLYKTRK